MATLFALRRAVPMAQSGLSTALSFSGSARLFFTDRRWQPESKTLCLYRYPAEKGWMRCKAFAGQVTAGVDAVAHCTGPVAYCAWMMNSICRRLPAEDEDQK